MHHNSCRMRPGNFEAHKQVRLTEVDKTPDNGCVNVAVLCAARNSVYSRLGCDTYDEARDAFSFNGGKPVIAHPPCRLFGRLSQFASGTDSEFCREIILGLWCVRWVQRCGGVLEHPEHSALFQYADLPTPGNSFGVGFTIEVPQFWFGHRALKRTWLYIVGKTKRQLPEMPFRLERYTGSGNGHNASVRLMCRTERKATPVGLAEWLIRVATPI